jgi:hypothetical protein
LVVLKIVEEDMSRAESERVLVEAKVRRRFRGETFSVQVEM